MDARCNTVISGHPHTSIGLREQGVRLVAV